jgi:hypothetical protein
MKKRCHNPIHKSFDGYGFRGIVVCDEWRNNSSSFIEWALANGYKEGLQIDRIDNEGNYEPDNCRFVEPQINNCNQRMRHDNKSGYRGVGWSKRLNKWMAVVTNHSQKHYLGSFNNAIDAAVARDAYIISNDFNHTLNFTASNNYGLNP